MIDIKDHHYSEQSIRNLRQRFLLCSDKNTKLFPTKGQTEVSLIEQWEAYKGVRIENKTSVALAKELKTNHVSILIWTKKVKETLERPLITPRNSALEEKRKAYFSRPVGRCGKGEVDTESTMLRNWDIFMRREIQRPATTAPGIQAQYPDLHRAGIARVVKEIWDTIGPFEETDLLKEEDALKEYLGLPKQALEI